MTTIIRGRPLPFVDTLGNVLGVANKAIFLNHRFEDHAIGPEVEAAMDGFIERHEIDGLAVRLNQYDPIGELGRLFSNGRVNIVLRLLLGLPLWLAYTLNVGRLVGGDHYNPYSDTVNLYSGHTSIALHELGHVLDFRRRSFPGLYSLIRFIPGVALYQEYLASLYAIEFLREQGDVEEELRAFRLLFPAYSTYVFGAICDFFPSAAVKWVLFPVIALGHVLGNAFAHQRAEALAETGVANTSVAGQWAREFREALGFFSPAGQSGRDFFGVAIGMAVGSALCGVMSIPGAWLGFKVARSQPAVSPPPRQITAT